MYLRNRMENLGKRSKIKNNEVRILVNTFYRKALLPTFWEVQKNHEMYKLFQNSINAYVLGIQKQLTLSNQNVPETWRKYIDNFDEIFETDAVLMLHSFMPLETKLYYYKYLPKKQESPPKDESVYTFFSEYDSLPPADSLEFDSITIPERVDILLIQDWIEQDPIFREKWRNQPKERLNYVEQNRTIY